MRTRGAMGRMVDKMTKSEKNDLMDLLGRIEAGVHNATGRLDTPQTRKELEDVRVTKPRIVANANYHGSNVTAFPSRTKQAPEPMAPTAVNDMLAVHDESNVIVVRQGTAQEIKKQPIKAFPKEFYDYFEFVEESGEKRTG